jgi:hippurate hydrolase
MNRTVQYRRDLHQIPELQLDLPETSAYIKNVLQDLSCTLIYPSHSAVCAFFDFGKEETIAFRSDMDALPLHEKTGLPFASRHEGAAHSCGHDAHMAMLLEFANRIEEMSEEEKAKLDKNIMLIFQPGEESPGGAKLIVESGLFDDYHISHIFGIHMWPLLAAGTVATKPGPLMARSCEINVEFTGKGAHAGRKAEGIDALAAAADFFMQTLELEKELNTQNMVHVLHFGKMEAGRVRNAVADKALLQGTLRVFSEDDFERIQTRLKQIAKKIDSKYGTNSELFFSEGYPALINDNKTAEKILASLDVKRLEHPEMISEDFSYYLQKVPGVFFYLGSGKNFELHDPAFDIDENVLENGASLYQNLLSLFAKNENL